MSKLVKNYIYNILYQIFLVIVPLVTAPYLSRVLGTEALGTYSYINSVVSVITTFGLLGLQSYGYRQIAYERNSVDGAIKAFSSLLALRFILLGIISVIYIPLSFLSYDRFYYLIQYALIFAQFVDVSWVFIGYEDLGIVSFRNFVAKFITVIGIFVFVKSDADLWVYFSVFAFTTLITTVSIYPILNKYVKFKIPPAKSIFFHLKPAVLLFIPQIATTLYLQFDKIMLKGLSGSASQVAFYDYAEKIINIPLALITALGTVMMPRLANLHANHDSQKISEYLNKTVRFVNFLSIPLAMGLAGISCGFIPWYLGDNYTATAYAIIVLCPICILNALSNVFGAQYLTAVNKTKVLTIAYYSAAVVDIIGNALLIPEFGCTGAAIATVLCMFASVFIQYISIRKDIKLVGCFKNTIKNTVSSTIMLVTISVLFMFLQISVMSTLVEIIAGVAVYFAMEFLLKDAILFDIIGIGKGFLCRIKKK